MAHYETYDTYRIIKRLIKSGLVEAQAKEIVAAISEGREFELSRLVTKDELSHLATKEEQFVLKAEIKADIAEIKADLAGVKVDLAGVKVDLAGVKVDLAGVKVDLAGIKVDLKEEVSSLRIEMEKRHVEIVKWIAGLNIATTSILLTLFKLFAL